MSENNLISHFISLNFYLCTWNLFCYFLHILSIVLSSWQISPFASEYPFPPFALLPLFLEVVLALKFILFAMSFAV